MIRTSYRGVGFQGKRIRLRMANSHCPDDVLSFAEWGRAAVQFGITVKDESYFYAVAHGIEAKYYYYRKWARVHLERKSLVGRDFVRYLAVKERYFGTLEDEAYLRATAAPVGDWVVGFSQIEE